MLAAAISGASGGRAYRIGGRGIDPTHIKLQFGIAATMHIGMAAAVINSVIGVAAYLQKSPCLKEICSGGFYAATKAESIFSAPCRTH